MGVGFILTVVGVIMSGATLSEFIKLLQGTLLWYYYQSEMESCETAFFVGLAITIIGEIVLIVAHYKTNDVNKLGK